MQVTLQRGICLPRCFLIIIAHAIIAQSDGYEIRALARGRRSPPSLELGRSPSSAHFVGGNEEVEVHSSDS